MLPRGAGRGGLRALGSLVAVAAAATALGGVPSASAVPDRAQHGKVSVTKVGSGDGRVTSSPGGIDCGPVCSFSFVSNDDPPNYQPVTLTATANPGSAFDGFDGCGSSCTIDPVEPGKEYAVVAQFSRIRPSTFGLTVGVNGQGRVTSSPSGIDCGTACSATFATDSSVTLTAVPTPGWSFSGWSGACSGTGTCTVTMSGPVSVTAVFAPPDSVHTLAVATAGGTVTSDIFGISCGAQCVAAYGVGVTVTLTASGGPVSWGGACEGTAPTCAVTMSGARVVTASFGGSTLGSAPVAVSVSGKGRVTGAGGIDCGTVCGTVVAVGASLTVSAAPAEGWVFAGWGDACSGVATSCTFAARGPATVAATFVEAGTRYAVVVTKAGQGTVTSRPPGISCGAQCSGEFGAGTTAVLTAAPTKGWTFVRWSGACTGSRPSCALGMNGPKAVSATFGLPADRTAPRLRALPATGSRGATVRLPYRVVDSSGRTREVATVYAGPRRLARLRGPQHALDAGALYYFIPWRSAKAAATRFCITSTDPTGNVSRPSCASVRIS